MGVATLLCLALPWAAVFIAGLPECAAEERHGREKERRDMVRVQIQGRDVKDPRVLDAMKSVPRHLFVPERYAKEAYADTPLPIGHGQTISQPYIVAYMTEALSLKGDERVLEIGTGSGYQAAVLSLLVKEVYTIEILKPLADEGSKRLTELGYGNVHVKCGDGYLGWPGEAPFDAIMVTAAPPEIPKALVEQLRVGGKMVLPVGGGVQDLIRVTKTADGVKREKLLPVRFVPMVHGEDTKR